MSAASLRLALPAILAGLVVAACGGSGTPSTPRSAPAPQARSTASSVDPNFDFGQTVVITRSGFRPRWLVSLVGHPIVWRNESGRPASIVFDHADRRSGVIPPGGTYRYDPLTEISLTYHSGSDPRVHGAVQVTPEGTS